MKTIEVTDEMYNFLSNLSKEIKMQDNRGTAKPYFFQVMEEEEVVVPDGCGEVVWVQDGQICLRTEEDVKKAVWDYYGWPSMHITEDNSEEDLARDCEEEYKSMSPWEIEEVLEVNYKKVCVDKKEKFSNCFFTEKACNKHIEINGHNLNNPHSYLHYAYRNKEMEMLFKFLEESFHLEPEISNEDNN